MTETKSTHIKAKHSSVKSSLCVGIILILLAGLVFLSVALYKEKNKQLTPADIEALQKEQVNSVLTEISKHMVLPKDEQPTIATITDVDSLRKDMPFFDKAQNGFKVIVYKEKAILFDPVNDIIIDVAPVIQKKDAAKVQDQQVNKNNIDTKVSDKDKANTQKDLQDKDEVESKTDSSKKDEKKVTNDDEEDIDTVVKDEKSDVNDDNTATSEE